MSSGEDVDDINENENLICPICLHLPDNEIFQCKNGHAVCAVCCESMTTCPQCRVSYDEGKIRNRAMESFLGSMKSHCPYKSNGCTQILRRSELQDHKTNCVYNGKSIQFCKLAGFNCDFWTNTLDASSAPTIAHLVDIHGFIYRSSSSQVNIRLENFVGDTLSSEDTESGSVAEGGAGSSQCQDSIWTPIILECKFRKEVDDSDSDDSDDDSVKLTDVITTEKFVIFCKYHEKDKSLSWWCSLIGSCKENASNHGIMFKIKSCSEKAPDLEWTVPPSIILQANVTLPMSPLRTPVESLHKYYVDEDGGLLVNVQILCPVDFEEIISDDVDREEEEIETIWAFKISLRNYHRHAMDERYGLLSCNECLSTEVLFKCSTCSMFSYFVCGKCVETGGHPGNHVFVAVTALENVSLDLDTGIVREARREAEEMRLEESLGNGNPTGDIGIGAMLKSLDLRTSELEFEDW